MSLHDVSDSHDTVQERIQITVKGQDQRQVPFMIAPDKKLHTLFNTYCRRRELDARSIQFLYKGERIYGNQTPKELKMKHNCEINAMMHQMGGGSSGGAV